MGTAVGGGQELLFLRWKGGVAVILREGFLEVPGEAAVLLLLFLAEEMDGRVGFWTWVERLEDEAEETRDVGAVDVRLVEGRCDVVGREEVCTVVRLWRRLLRGGNEIGAGFSGETCSLRFPRAFLDGAGGDMCSCAVSKLEFEDFDGEVLVVRAASLCSSSSILFSRAS